MLLDINIDGEIDITDAERLEIDIDEYSLIAVPGEGDEHCIVCMESLQDANSGTFSYRRVVIIHIMKCVGRSISRY